MPSPLHPEYTEEHISPRAGPLISRSRCSATPQVANTQQADLAAAPEDLMDIDQREGPQEPEVPGKFVADEAEIHVRCKVQFVDFEGLTDGRSIKNILPQVQPKSW